MKRFWQWLKDRWLEHKAFKGHGTARGEPQQGYTPIVGIAQDAVLRWRVSRRRR
jgi:hypothetical protein